MAKGNVAMSGSFIPNLRQFILALSRVLPPLQPEKGCNGYVSENGARVGDLFMSLIHSCQLCGANSLDDLTGIQKPAAELSSDPARWMPWNYRDELRTWKVDTEMAVGYV